MSKMIEGEVGWNVKTIHWTSAIEGVLEFYSDFGWSNLPEPTEVFDQMYCGDVPWTNGDAVFTLVSLEVFIKEVCDAIDSIVEKDSGELQWSEENRLISYDTDTLVIIEG